MRGKKLLFLFVFLLIIGIFIYHNIVKSFDKRIYPCVYLNDMDISNMNQEEVLEIISNKINSVLEGNIVVILEDEVFEKPLKSFDVKSDVKDKIERAYDFGKNGNEINKFINIVNPKELKLDLSYTFNSEEVEKWVNTIDESTRTVEEDSKISINKGEFQVIDEVVGRKLKKDELLSDIKYRLSNLHLEEELILEAEMEDSYPKIRTETLKSINKLISTYSTNFGGVMDGRGINIKIATEEINGKLLMPNEVFSFNEIVGMSTPDKGYRLSPIIVENKIVEGYGGGVCQVSTTLYNAVLRSSILPTERRNHSLIPAYVRPGMDAAIFYGSLDLKFQNTLEYPIYIEGYINDGDIVFNIYSNESLTKYHYDVVSEVYNYVSPKEVFKDDPSLKKGELKKIQNSVVGCSASTYLICYNENNEEISRELISTDFYSPLDAIYLKGTKKEVSESNEEK